MRTTVRSVLTLGAACVLGVSVGVLVNSSGLDREALQEPPVSVVVDSSPTPSSFAPEVNSTLEKAVEDPQPTRTRSATRAPAADQDDDSGKGSFNSGRGGGNRGRRGGDDDDDSGGDD